MQWLAGCLEEAGLWGRGVPFSASVVFTERFEVFLVRRAGARAPELAVKLPRDAESAVMLAREEEFLLWAWRAYGGAIEASVPRCLGSFSADGHQVWVQSALEGRQIRPGLDAQMFDRVSAWLAALGARTRNGVLGEDELFHEGMDKTQPHVKPRARLGSNSPREALAWKLASELADRIPGVLCHGDFNPTNVLCDKSRIGAVDWVWGEQKGRPLFDWFDFCSHAYLLSTGSGDPSPEKWSRAVRALRQGGGPLHTLLSRGAERIGTAVGLGVAVCSQLLTLYICSRFWAMVGFLQPEYAEHVVECGLGLSR